MYEKYTITINEILKEREINYSLTGSKYEFRISVPKKMIESLLLDLNEKLMEDK